ncbi:MAG: hypothetical protein J0I57_04105 [Hyphomicrobium sp.]|jgi:hypothetical protein|nr:hypothetical protein [Hyphomicrobium sp.]MBN9276799.1 hypothetical protein [Hyphomicrobium sp.]OJU30532.1 MAG: hypothetical protein BGN89_14480 [Alphaproteobacteria bacterium 64-6]
MLFPYRRPIVYGFGVAIAACMVLGVFAEARGRWLTSAGLLMDILGLALLDISGAFTAIFDEARKRDDAGEPIPSAWTREFMEEYSEIEWVANLRHRIFSEPVTGVQVIAAGCVVQLVGTWV